MRGATDGDAVVKMDLNGNGGGAISHYSQPPVTVVELSGPEPALEKNGAYEVATSSYLEVESGSTAGAGAGAGASAE